MTPRTSKIQDESELVARARDGDDEAFERIVSAYGRRIVGYCHKMAGRSMNAEDLAQEVFVKLYLALPRFDTSKPLAPFLFRIAHNHCLDALRRKRVPTVSLVREDGEGKASEVEHPDARPSPEELAQRAEVMDAVEEALGSLPAPYRSALVLYHVEGMSYEEISRTLGVPMGTVKARIHRGREKLQQKLSGLVVP